AFNNGKTRKMANVYVAEGVYMPTETIDRTKTFPMYNVRLVGGFDSLSTAIDTTLRNMNLHETIFSGEIGNPLTITDNSYHVVESNGQSVIDGITIRDGAALIAMYGDENYAYNRGGGIYVSQFGRLSLKNCNVINNCSWYQGGGVFTFSGSSINVENCVFTGNHNAQVASGGGIIVVVVNTNGGTLFCSNIHAKNSYFYDDASFAPIFIESNYSVGEFENCTFEGSGNSPVITSRSGARVYLTNCTVNAGLTSNVGGTFYIKNSTILGDISFAILRNTSHAYIDNSILTSQNVSDTLISAQYSILGQTLVGSDKEDIINDSIPSVTTWLDTLAYNGGFTPTMKLKNMPNNPAKSSGNLQYLGTADQRGTLRIDSVSIGAYQYDFPNTGIVEVKAFPEGLFNPATGSLSKSRNASGEQFGGAIADKITMELHDVNAPYNQIGTAFTANLLTTGFAHSMATTPLPDSFYIVVKHRNSLETWSSAPVAPVNGLVQYDFTQQINSAFGNKLKPLGSYFGIYSGDVNQNGVLDELDMNQIGIKANIFGVGYLPEDLNGDGVIDALDMILLDNNSTIYINTISP
ncbi:MAG: right-handed parallel beta-helix repeat-containing protein, partial [Bacteroidales bacterium]